MNIVRPRLKPDHPDYNIECQEALDLAARDLIDKAILVGWVPREVYKALAEVVHNQALAYEEDPDPDEDRT